MTLASRTRSLLWCVLAIVVAAAAPNARASFHFMQIEQIIGGVGGDVTKQAIQLRMRSSFQNQMQAGRLIAFDAAGMNPIVVATFPGPVSNAQLGDRILVCTPGFLASTTPGTVPDAMMSTPIPASYLAAGRLTFEDFFGTIYWMVCWGGAAYTGPTTGSFTNDNDGNFGPAFPGPLPSMGAQALRFPGAASAPSTNNAADYVVTAGPAVFTNNARSSFTVMDAPPAMGACCVSGNCQVMTPAACQAASGTYNGDNSACTPELCTLSCRCDWNQSGALNSQDFFDFLAAFFSGGGDFNNDNQTTSQDFFDFLACFFSPPPAC